MQIKEKEATPLLLLLLLTSIYFQDKEVLIPNHYIDIIDHNKIPLYETHEQPITDWRNNPNIEIDTSSYLDIISNVESDFGKNWMRRYNKGIRFEFYPPN